VCRAEESLASKNKCLAALDRSTRPQATNHWQKPTRLGIHASSTVICCAKFHLLIRSTLLNWGRPFMFSWLIPIVLGALVAGAVFLVASIFSNKLSSDTAPRRQGRSFAILAAVVCFAVAIYAVYPYVTLWRISNALQTRDGELLASFIDWPTARTSEVSSK